MTRAATQVRPHEAAPPEPRALRVSVGDCRHDADVSLAVAEEGPWPGLLGGFPLPAATALDALTAAMADRPAPARVEIAGTAAACLLPVMWLKTIWLPPQTPVSLHWSPVAPPGPDQREILAAQLCSAIVAHVKSDDDASVESLWGVACGPVGPPDARVFDLLLGLVDCWDISLRGGFITDPSEWHVRARAALEACRDRGLTRVALYGAGTHTRALGPLLLSPPVEIVCIIDDDPDRQGGRMWGFPIVSREQALGLGVSAVILSANVHEPSLWKHAGCLREAGVEVIRLYEDVWSSASSDGLCSNGRA